MIFKIPLDDGYAYGFSQTDHGQANAVINTSTGKASAGQNFNTDVLPCTSCFFVPEMKCLCSTFTLLLRLRNLQHKGAF